MLEIGQEWLLYATPFRLKEVAAAPSGGEIIQDVVSLYAKDKAGTSHLYWQDDDGVEHDLEGNLFGSGTTNRLAYWSSSSTLAANAALTATRVMFADANGLPTDDADLTFATDTLTATKLTSTNVGIGGAPGSLPLEVYASANDTLTGIMIRSQASPTTRYGIATHQGGVFYFTSIDQAALDSEQSFIFRQHSLGSGTGREIARFGPLGGLHVGSSGSSIALGVIDAATGYRVANAATSGNVLRGNGTNFVSAQLAHSDLSGLTTGDPHTQYALLVGRSGGQVLIGGTQAADDLVLQSTSGNGSGDTIVFKRGNNGAHSVLTANVGGLTLNSPSASSQFNLSFADNGTDKFIIYKYANNASLAFFDSSSSQDILKINAVSGLAAFTAAVSLFPSISSSNATAIGMLLQPVFTGTGDGPWGFSAQPDLRPTGNLSAAYGNLSRQVVQQLNTNTITNLIAAYYDCIFNSTDGAVTGAFTLWCNGPNIGSGGITPTTQTGLVIQNQGASGITNVVGLNLANQSGGTNNWLMELPADATDPTSGGGAATGRIKCLIGGATRYIPYY